MKTENKYYTPEIEEFHVGFEFEFTDDEKGVNVFTENCPYPLEVIKDFIHRNLIHVKCIDREDVESLGWEMEKVVVQDDDENDTFSDGFVKYTDNGDWFEFVEISKYNFYIQKKWYRNSVTQMCRTVFYGNIKNKSELIRLMKQLNIQQ